MYAVCCWIEHAKGTEQAATGERTYFQESSESGTNRGNSQNNMRKNPSSATPTGTVNKLNTSRKCWRCGYTDHTPDSCRFKEKNCHKCHQKGHTKFRCDDVAKFNSRNKKKGQFKRKGVARANQVDTDHGNEVEAEEDDDGFALYRVYATSSETKVDVPKPYKVKILCNERSVNFEVDTAASFSIIGESLYRSEFSNSELKPCDIRLRSYSGEKLELLGQFKCKVDVKEQQEVLPLIVCKGNKVALLGRNWLEKIKLDWARIFSVKNDPRLGEIINKYPSVFSGRPGEIVGFTADIPIDEDVTPIFKKAYSVPFPLQGKVRQQLRNDIDKGLYKRVDSSDWASPQVTVLKQDGSLRMCGDYKVTVNQVMKKDPYPLPSTDELFAGLSGKKYFTKIDLANAFQQLPLTDRSKEILTVNTLEGLLQYQRMPYGIRVAPQIFQKMMDKILAGVEDVKCSIDDILMGSDTLEEGYVLLDKVLARLDKHNIRARLSEMFLSRAALRLRRSRGGQ